MRSTMHKDFVSITQTCEILNRTPKMLDIYVKKNLLTKYMILGEVCFKKSEVDNLLIPKPVSETRS